MSSTKYTVGLVQMAMGERPADNIAKAAGFVREAAGKGAQVICLPEMFASQYFCQREDVAFYELAEPIHGPSVEAMQTLAAELRVAIVVPIFERRGPGMYHNSLAMVNEEGGLAGVYRKMHIPDDPSYYEKFYFTPGRSRVQGVHRRRGHHRDADLLGPVVPGGRAADRAPGRVDPLLPDGHRLAPAREGAVRRGAARRLAHGAARARHRQRDLRRGGQPRRATRSSTPGHRASSSGVRRSCATRRAQ